MRSEPALRLRLISVFKRGGQIGAGMQTWECPNCTFKASTSAKVERSLGKPARSAAAARISSGADLSEARSPTCSEAAYQLLLLHRLPRLMIKSNVF